MENTLKETEWLTINKVLLEMYDITDIDQFTERVLKTYRMLIPYTKGYFIVFNEAGGIESEKSLRKESKVVQTKKQYGDFSLTALSFASISIFSG